MFGRYLGKMSETYTSNGSSLTQPYSKLKATIQQTYRILTYILLTLVAICSTGIVCPQDSLFCCHKMASSSSADVKQLFKNLNITDVSPNNLVGFGCAPSDGLQCEEAPACCSGHEYAIILQTGCTKLTWHESKGKTFARKWSVVHKTRKYLF